MKNAPSDMFTKYCFVFLCLCVGLSAQTAIETNLGSKLTVDESTTPPTFNVTWWGTSGMHYIVESTPDLATWTFLPNFNPPGEDAIQGIQFTTSADKYFFRVYQLDPNDISSLTDSDNDGLPDKWELYQFGTLSRNGALDYDNDGISDADEYQLGLNPKFNEVNPAAITYDYDAIGRLTGVTGNNNAASFLIDAEGNVKESN